MKHDGVTKTNWGGEYMFADTDLYCGKLMYFKKDAVLSMHLHKDKDESWCVLQGLFEIQYIDTSTAEIHSKVLTEGDTWRNMPLEPHQLVCLEEGVIIEVSTPETATDSYQILPSK